jgi:hypothetical protein
MPVLRVVLDVDAHDDPSQRTTAGHEVIHLPDPDMAFIRVPHGMTSGKDSVFVQVFLPDGRVVMAETSMELFLAAARAFAAKSNS